MPGATGQLFRARLLASPSSSSLPSSSASHWSVLSGGVVGPPPPPARRGTGTLPAGIQQALAAALGERLVGGIFFLFLSLCFRLPYHLEPQGWFLRKSGLSDSPEEGGKEPGPHSQPRSPGMCCHHGFLFPFHKAVRASWGQCTSMALPFLTGIDAEPVQNCSWAWSRGNSEDQSLANFPGEFQKYICSFDLI